MYADTGTKTYTHTRFFKGFDICLAPCLGYVQCQVLQFCQLTIHLSQLRLSTSSANAIENTPSLQEIENKKQTQGYMHIRTLDCWLCTLCVFFLFFVWFQFFCSAILLYEKNERLKKECKDEGNKIKICRPTYV